MKKNLTRFFAMLLTAVTVFGVAAGERPRSVAPTAAAGMPQLLGSVIWSATESDYFSAYGLFTIPTNDSQQFNRLFRYANAHYGGVLIDKTYYTCEYYEFPGYGANIYYTGYDLETGREVYSASGTAYTYSMTYDATTSTVYAIANLDRRFVLVKIIFDTENRRMILDPVNVITLEEYGLWNSIACDSKGQLWGIYSDCVLPQSDDDPMVCTGSTLYKINKETAALTKVGETGFDSLYASDATFDLKTDRLFWTVSNASDEGLLTEVDTTTGKATVIYVFPGNEEVTGLVIPTPEAADDAPAAPTDLKANFAGASLSGTVDFRVPATLFDGTPASGAVAYTVLANGQSIATGSTTFGAKVAAAVTLPSAGFYTFSVTLSNAAGPSPAVETKAYVGADTPESTSVTAAYAGGTMTVSWNPVTASINGGYIDVNAITYTVTRFPDKKVVADKISATTFTEKLDIPAELTNYYYEVVASYAGLNSTPAKSNVVSLGAVTPPFTATFDDSLNGFSVVDSNGDGTTWSAIDGHAQIIYNRDLDMDDWLISPAIKLSAGKIYDIAAQFSCGNEDVAERIEVKVGKSADPDAMTTVLLRPTVINQPEESPLEWSDVFAPETDGYYYVGLHGISDKNTFILFVDNFSITTLKNEDGPAPIRDFKVTPGADGALTATIAFTTPSTTISGKPLSELTKIELMRDGRLIHTWTAPALNTALTYTDRLPEANDYVYSILPYSSLGSGIKTEAEVYVGINYPAAVDGVRAFESGNKPGEVTIVWNAVTMSEDSVPIDPALVKYRVNQIINGNGIAITGFIEGTSYTYQAVEPGTQDFVQYAMIAATERGYGDILNCSLSSIIPAGTPYNDFQISSQADIDKYLIGINSRGGGAWSVYDDMFMPSQDGDNRLLAMYAAYEDSYGDLYTGLISLKNFTKPALTFYTYNIGDLADNTPDTNEITVSVRVNGTPDFVDAKTVVVSETGPANCWNRIIVDLSPWAGQTIQLNFYSIVKAASYTIIDNIKVGNLYANDLAMLPLQAPEKVTAGNRFTINATVANEGTADSGDYTVELYAANQLVASKQGPAIAGGLQAQVDFELTMSPIASGNIVYTAKVVTPTDENNANDRSAGASVKVEKSTLPAATDLSAAATDSDIRLSWTAPDLDAIKADAITEDFEDGLPFTSRYGEWVFIDGDGVPVDGFSNVDIPNIIAGKTTGSFWIWDTKTLGNGDQYLGAHSGSKYLFALYRTDMGRSDEWAISPELNGEAQTISIYAKSYHSDYPEQIKLSYSDGSIDPADFTVVKTVGKVANDWTEYKFDVPAGAKRFAINSCATNSFMLMVDDVTYIPANAPRTVSFEGYDVYRNGLLLNSELLSACDYADTSVEEGHTYEYTVVAVYNKGTAAPSNSVSVAYKDSGIDQVNSNDLNISAARGSIIVSGAQGLQVAVYTVDGKTIYSAVGSDLTVIPVQPGIYVVKAGSTARTLSVK